MALLEKKSLENNSLQHSDGRVSMALLIQQKQLSLLIWLGLFAIALTLAVIPLNQVPWLSQALMPFSNHVSLEKAVYSPVTYLLLLTLVFWLEVRYPVRDQAIISTSFLQDALWYAMRAIFRITLISGYYLLLTAVYDRYLSFLTIQQVAGWHPALKALAAIVLVDFTRWLGHFIKHKVHAFWVFHAVHHSQRELNLFTDARAHPVDQMVSRTIRFIPLLMFQNAFPVIVAWLVIESAYAKLYHANIRLNMGPLRYIFVTPQSHRIHHSRAREHYDRNFGFMFSIWDRIFGTHYEGGDEYPETGIPDPHFPHERRGDTPVQMVINIVRQLLYPFHALLRGQETRVISSETSSHDPDFKDALLARERGGGRGRLEAGAED